METEQIMYLADNYEAIALFRETKKARARAELKAAVEALEHERDVAKAALRLEHASAAAWRKGWEKSEAEVKTLRDALEKAESSALFYRQKYSAVFEELAKIK